MYCQVLLLEVANTKTGMANYLTSLGGFGMRPILITTAATEIGNALYFLMTD